MKEHTVKQAADFIAQREYIRMKIKCIEGARRSVLVMFEKDSWLADELLQVLCKKVEGINGCLSELGVEE